MYNTVNNQISSKTSNLSTCDSPDDILTRKQNKPAKADITFLEIKQSFDS